MSSTEINSTFGPVSAPREIPLPKSTVVKPITKPHAIDRIIEATPMGITKTSLGRQAQRVSVRVGGNDLSAGPSTQRPPGVLVNRVLDEPDASVGHQRVDSARVE